MKCSFFLFFGIIIALNHYFKADFAIACHAVLPRIFVSIRLTTTTMETQT